MNLTDEEEIIRGETAPAHPPTVRLFSLIEASTVTGPAKNLIHFCQSAREQTPATAGLPVVAASIATFHRVPENTTAEARADHAFTPFIKAVRDAEIPIDVIYERGRFDRKIINQLRRAVAHREPQIIQTHGVKGHFLARLARLQPQYRWIAYHHGYTTTDLKMRAYNQLNRWSLPAADHVITVCGPFADNLVKIGVKRENISVLHNSITPSAPASQDDTAALRAKLGIAPDERVLLTVGRFSLEKGHLDLIEAVARLCADASELKFKLLLLGDGPRRPRIERAVAASYCLQGKVVFAGHVGDVRPFYTLADMLVLPSHSEGSPNVLLEAMAAHLPAVATNVGGVPEIAKDGETALLVPSHAPPALADAIKRLLVDHKLARVLGDNAFATVASSFSLKSYERSLIEIYERVIGKKKVRRQKPELSSG